MYHYLDKIANNDSRGQSRGLSHRMVRSIVSVYKVKNKEELKIKLQDVLDEIDSYYDGQKNSKIYRN